MENLSSHYDKRLLNLQSTIFLSTYRRKNIPDLISNLEKQEGISLTLDYSSWNRSNQNYSEIYDLWKKCNFNSSSIKWVNYYPGQHFETELIDDIAFYLRLNGVHRAWISRLDPGYYAPPHYDVDDNEKEYLEKGNIIRYTIFLNNPTSGHVLIVGKDYLYDIPHGTIFKWKNYKEWHSGINCGLEPCYMIHLLSY